jgi:acetylglutamate kinase
MKIPDGFLFAGIHAGLKPSRKDLALIVSDQPCSTAGCFTANKARAAPVLDAERRLPAEGMRALIINSGNANAMTGPAGLTDVEAICEATARAVGAPKGSVLSASTGVIGMRLPLAKVLAAIPRLTEALRAEPDLAAEAILTTDVVIKMATRTVTLAGRDVTLSAIAKGSGMIAPQLATMIAAVVSDCDIEPRALQHALSSAMERSFNCLTVDGDMSTNDCVFALCNGRARNPRLHLGSPDFPAFEAALLDLCQELAKAIAQDGEGATKLLTVEVQGAPTFEIARDLARSVAGSPLVKTAIFGADPNWGRIVAGLGARAGAQNYPFEVPACSISLQGMRVFTRGEPQPCDTSVLRSKMREPEILVRATIGDGPGNATAYGCDLSYDYVKINADYTSLIVEAPGGGVAKDDRLVNYSPAFKVTLLLEVLSYIGRLKGQLCVVKYGGAAMVKESLKKSFCDDLGLLRSLGLKPVVVHGGGPEITSTLEKLGHKSEFIDGRRVTSTADLKVVEMVLTGAINSEIVTLLNRDGAHAVGVSGKDGALLRAKKRVSDDGRDLGQVGEITEVNKDFLKLLIDQGYLPVISPVGIGQDGSSYNINADDAAAAVAAALHADKLIYLTDVPGILEGGELLSELTADQLEDKLGSGAITGGMRAKAEAIIKTVRAGVPRVHVVDGRMPHSVIGELFTDRGVGTLVTP